MIICFDCPAHTKAELDELVQVGHYPNPGEAISVAIANLVVLHRKLGRGDAVVIHADQESAEAPKLRDGTNNGGAHPSPLKPKRPSAAAGADQRSIFLRPTEAPPNLAPLPDDVWATGQRVPANRWVFGQYNRLLPAKVNCRVLAHLLRQQPRGMELSKATSQIVQAVGDFREVLEELDARYELDRDDSLATGFPKTGQDNEKSRLRYANQFIASVNKSGQVAGLLIDLKLINFIPEKSPRLLLTEAGWTFAAMPNPILEGAKDRPSGRLTQDEQDFLLEHIAANVPVEDFAYRTVLNAIEEGAATPELLDAELAKFAPQSSGDDSMSAAFLSSQRSGAVARMSDLDLLSRARDGVRVSYVLTQRGRAYLNKHERVGQ